MKNRIKNTLHRVFLFYWNDNFKNETDLDVSRKIMLLNYVVVACVLFLIPFGIFSTLQGNYYVGFFDLVAGLLIGISIVYYKKTSNHELLGYSFIIILGSLFLFLLYSAGIDYSGPLWSYIFPVSVMFILGRRIGRAVVALYIILAIIILFIESSAIYSLNFKLRFIGSLAVTGIISYYIEYVREIMQSLLKEKNNALVDSLEKLEKQENELIEKELYYRTLFESSNDAIFIMNEGIFVECNPKTLEIFQCKKDDIINQPPAKFSPKFQPDGSLSSDKALEKINAALNDDPQYFEWVHKKLDGSEFFAEVNLNLIKIENKKLLQATVKNISHRKKVEAELVLAKERAEKSDMLKSDFLAQMSHEIRTPINTILNYTSLLKMELESQVSEDNKGSFKSIHTAAHRLLRTIDLILNISDLEAGTYEPKFEKINLLDQIIVPVVNEFKQSAQNKDIDLSFSVNVELPSIAIIDSYTVYQTIANLVDNAIKYTEHGSINLGLDKNNDSFIVKISDTGVGISKEYIPKLFEKFSQEEAGYTRRYDGSGLGLALVKNYCNINNINISVKSEKGVGTTFSLEFPIDKS